MTQRSERVYLPDHEPRCQPGAPCIQKQKCGRYLAALPKKGAIVADYSINLTPYSYLLFDGCAHHVDPMGRPAAAVAGPTVHDHIKGLS